MSDSSFALKEFAKLLGVLAHPERVQIIEELRARELDVNSLQACLGVAHARVSQNLSILRSHRIVVERREGRHVFYKLAQPLLAAWLLQGFSFLEREAAVNEEIRGSVGLARLAWSEEDAPSKAHLEL
jgi:DNA-binding transcriptional ArsR family regulator